MLTALLTALDRLMANKASSRPMWREDAPVVCAWCTPAEDPRHATATHGICRACQEKW